MHRWPLALAALLAAPEALASEVTLVSAGSGPQRLLALGAPEAGRQAAAFSMDLSTRTEVLGQQVAVDVPVVEAGLDVASAPVEGGFEVTYAYRDVRVGQGDGMGRMIAEPMAKGLAGATGTLRLTPSGAVTEARVQAPALGGQPPSGSDEGFDLALWLPRLPEVPVGVGATWTASTQEVDARGFTWDATTTWKLVALEGDRATLAIEVERRSSGGMIAGQGMPVTVRGIVTRGSGTSVVLLGRPFPASGAWRMDVEMELAVGGMATKQITSMAIQLTGGDAP